VEVQYKCLRCKCCETKQENVEFESPKIVNQRCYWCHEVVDLERECFPSTNLTIIVQGEPENLGHLAERNSQKFGNAYCEDKMAESQARLRKAKGQSETTPTTPWWRNGSVPGLERSEKPLAGEQLKKTIDKFKKTGGGFKRNNLPPKRRGK
jgi:hypothetical protein